MSELDPIRLELLRDHMPPLIRWPERVVMILVAITFCPLFLLVSLMNANNASEQWMVNVVLLEWRIFLTLILPLWAMMRIIYLAAAKRRS